MLADLNRRDVVAPHEGASREHRDKQPVAILHGVLLDRPRFADFHVAHQRHAQLEYLPDRRQVGMVLGYRHLGFQLADGRKHPLPFQGRRQHLEHVAEANDVIDERFAPILSRVPR